MAESRDPTIKLFGKTIKLTAEGDEGGGDEEKGPSDKEANHESEDKNEEASSSIEEEMNDEQTIMTNEEQVDPNASSPEEKNSEGSEQPNEGNKTPQDKSPKKPDKILHCPRCNSTDTKFCYYNNYNTNQPRHFCKNCQRYWTDGGSMRNVPVGAGRRKSKSSAANHHYRQIAIPDCVHSSLPESIHLQHLNSNGTVLSFGSDAPLCESMASVLNLVDKTMNKRNRNGILQAENGEEQSSGSSVTASNSCDQGKGGSANSNSNGFPPNVAYFNGTPWPYPWSHPPPFCSSNLPIPFYPLPAYWGMPCLSQQLSTSPSSGSSSCSGPNSPTLGKHSREGNVLKHRDSDKGGSPKPEKCLWIPKIDDPEKAAKCSVWATMGLFKNTKDDSINKGGGLFQAFESNGGAKTLSSQVLHANPAALSRFLSFQESSLAASAHGVSGF